MIHSVLGTLLIAIRRTDEFLILVAVAVGVEVCGQLLVVSQKPEVWCVESLLVGLVFQGLASSQN